MSSCSYAGDVLGTAVLGLIQGFMCGELSFTHKFRYRPLIS